MPLPDLMPPDPQPDPALMDLMAWPWPVPVPRGVPAAPGLGLPWLPPSLPDWGDGMAPGWPGRCPGGSTQPDENLDWQQYWRK